MTEETTPSVEEIKARLKVEVPVEEEEVTKASAQAPDVTAELREFGKQFADTIRSAWKQNCAMECAPLPMRLTRPSRKLRKARQLTA